MFVSQPHQMVFLTLLILFAFFNVDSYANDNFYNKSILLAQNTDEIHSKGPIEKFFYNITGKTEGPLMRIASNRLDWGYDRGFFLESRRRNFRVKMNIWGQIQYSITGDNDDVQQNITVRRFRIQWNGHVYKTWIHYVIQLSLDNQLGGQSNSGFEGFKLKDFFFDIAYNIVVVPRIGQYKVPFNREELSSSKALLLVERSIVNGEFGWGRDRGVGIYGQLGNIITYGTSVTTGNGVSGIADSKVTSALLYAGRIQYQPCCGKLKFSDGAFPSAGDYNLSPYVENRHTPITEAGLAVMAFPNLNIDEQTPDNNIDVRFEELGITEGDVYSLSANLSYKYNIYNVVAEYDIRWINSDEKNIGTVTDFGFRTQGGIFLIPEIVELAGRFAFINYDDDQDILPGARESSYEFTPGINFFISKDKIWKVQVSYSYLKTNFTDNTEDGESIIRAQFQFQF